MFNLLKKKLSKAVESISEKLKKKEEVAEKVEQQLTKIEEEVKSESIEKPAEIIEKVEEEIPEIKEEVEEVAKEEKPKEKRGFFKRLAEKVAKKVSEKKLTEEDLTPILDELVTDLIESDVAVEVAEKIKENLKNNLLDKDVKRGKEKEVIVSALKQSILDILSVPQLELEKLAKENKPAIILFLGFNGSGKTTSLAKIASWLISKNLSCVFAAADTFRAAAEEQLEIHAKNLKVNLIKHRYGADPAAVIFDAIEHAKAKGIDIVLADTAGRAHTNKNLMEQMKKIVKVNKPHLKVLVVDSLTGNDAVLQARMYNEVGVDAIVFTKVDVNEKGGAILSVTHELKKPILFLGSGQEYANLEIFDPKKFVERLFD